MTARFDTLEAGFATPVRVGIPCGHFVPVSALLLRFASSSLRPMGVLVSLLCCIPAFLAGAFSVRRIGGVVWRVRMPFAAFRPYRFGDSFRCSFLFAPFGSQLLTLLSAGNALTNFLSAHHRHFKPIRGVTMPIRAVRSFVGVLLDVLISAGRFDVKRVGALSVPAFVVDIEAIGNRTKKNQVRCPMGNNRRGVVPRKHAITSARFGTNPLPAIRLPIQLQLLGEALKQILWRSSCSHGSVNKTVPRPGSESRTEQRQPRHETESVLNFCFSRPIQSRASSLPISHSFAT